MEGQLPGSLLQAPAEFPGLALPPTVYMLPRQTEQPAAAGTPAYGRLPEPPAEPQPLAEYIDLSKAHLSGLGEGAGPARDPGWDQVSLQHEYPRWQAAKQRLQLTEDHQLARALLDLYEISVASAQLIKSEDLHDATAVLQCEIRDTTKETTSKSVPASAPAPATTSAVETAAGSVTSPSALRPRRRLRPVNRNKPCPKSKKAGYRGREVTYADDADDSPAEDGGDPSPKLFTFPAVEPELLHYFSCNLCDESGFDDVETYFTHLWRTHAEFHMVGGRIQRIPIRLRPQLFVICALCGLNNKGSTGFSDTYLTTAHVPHHAPLLQAAAAAPLRCDTCRDEFADRGALALHTIDSEHENDAHRCTACGADVEGRLNYIAHLRRHYLSRLFQCYFCMTPFPTETGCVAHIKKHHADDYSVHKCSNCGYATALFHDFLLHIRSHSQLNRHVCHICGIMFVSKMSLKHHIPTHTDTQFPCEKCDKVFSHPQTRRRHVINAHHKPEKCTCNVCGRQFGSAYSMKRHYMIHTGERPFQCDKCGRGFVQKGDLHAHYKRCKFTQVTSVYVTI